MKLADAIVRLRRFGDENSIANQKLREAAWFLAQHVCAQAKEAKKTTLPRGYQVLNGRLYDKGAEDMGPEMKISVALTLARDVATGWLDEVDCAVGITLANPE